MKDNISDVSLEFQKVLSSILLDVRAQNYQVGYGYMLKSEQMSSRGWMFRERKYSST